MQSIGSEVNRGVRGTAGLMGGFQRVPLWLILLALIAAIVVFSVARSQSYSDIARFLSRGILLTIQISILGYALALVIGLVAGLGRLARNPIVNALATLYVEIVRGIPILVVILYVAYVITPPVGIRSNVVRGIIALAVTYGAYLAEVYRAGIQAVPGGQVEAGKALGLSQAQTMRFIVLPQAFRIILPPLGNDFIAMLKDSSLVMVISVPELTLQTRLYVSRTFQTFEGWTMAALLYLSMTLVLSMGVRLLERYSRVGER